MAKTKKEEPKLESVSEDLLTNGNIVTKTEEPEDEIVFTMDDSEEESDVSNAMDNCSDCGKECSSSSMKGDACSDCYTMKADMPAAVSEEDVNATTKMIDTINDHLTSALSTLAETVKALDAKIEGINKAIAGVSNEVSEVKDSFGKRVDAVEKDTAFRKSADLGEILQEQPVVVKKSLWGGSFLKNADLFK